MLLKILLNKKTTEKATTTMLEKIYEIAKKDDNIEITHETHRNAMLPYNGEIHIVDVELAVDEMPKEKLKEIKKAIKHGVLLVLENNELKAYKITKNKHVREIHIRQAEKSKVVNFIDDNINYRNKKTSHLENSTVNAEELFKRLRP